MLHFSVIFSLLVVSASYSVDARPSYLNSIPNGNLAPNPCSTGTWGAVGHTSPSNSPGGLNPFGRDFQAAGRKWTSAFCQKDSDGDGRTNGEELGDPNCIWTTGATPVRATDLGHPGICEPIDTVLCKGKNAFLTGSNCQAIGNSSTSSSNVPPVPNGGRPTRPPRVIPTTATPQNPWQLMRNCVCFCLDTANIGSLSNPSSGGRRRPLHDDDEDEEDDDDYEYDDDEDEDDDYQRADRDNNGRGNGRGNSGQGNNGRGNAGQGNNGRGNGRGGNKQKKSGQGQGRGQGQQPGRGRGRPGSGRQGALTPPPLNEAPEFNNTSQYNVKPACTCACPNGNTPL